jgi:phage gp45-like
MSRSWLAHSLENHDATLGTLRRATILKVDDSGAQQLVDLSGLASDYPKKVVRVLPHGFSSNPPLNSEGILKSLGGRSDRGMFIGGEHFQYRQRNLPAGTSVLYDDKGNVVFCKGANGIVISTADGDVTVTSNKAISLTATGGDVNVKATGGNIYCDPAGGAVFLGAGSSGAFAPVMTVSGPSSNVFAKIA